MRILTVIMFTDIEGFTRLMQNDETNAVNILEQYKKIIHQCIDQHKGRIIKYIGDGTLSIFSSALQAVKCAIALQRAFRKDTIIPVRIGIHTGEVIFENKDVIGDAVNLASRVQTKAVSGSVLVSEKVYEELANHPEIVTCSLGDFRLKNVLHPVHLYALTADGLVVPSAESLGEAAVNKTLSGSSKKLLFGLLPFRSAASITTVGILILLVAYYLFSNTISGKNIEYPRMITVFPFRNIGHDTDHYLATGLTEEIISLLSNNPRLNVRRIDAGTSENYSNKALVNLLPGIKGGSKLEGKIMKDSNNFVIYAYLTDIGTSKIIWSEKYNRDPFELIKVQRDVAQKICEALNANFDSQKQDPLKKRMPDPEAHDLYLRGKSKQKDRDRNSMIEANYYFRKAIERDSTYALAYSGLGDNYVILIDNGYITYDSGVNIARNALDKAFRLDSNIAEVRASKAIFLSSLEGRRMQALLELKQALMFAPNYIEAHQWYSLELAANGQFDSALYHINKAMESDPFSERIWDNKAVILMYARRYKDVIAMKDSLSSIFPGKIKFHETIAECYMRLDKKDSALISARLAGSETYQFWKANITSDNRILESLIDSTVARSDNGKNETLAYYYVAAGQYDKATKTIEDAYEAKEFYWLNFINVDPVWDPLRKYPAFQDFLNRSGF